MNAQYFGPDGYENFFVLDCRKVMNFDELREQLIEDLITLSFGIESSHLESRASHTLYTAESEKARESLRAELQKNDSGLVSTEYCVVKFLKEPTIEVWRGYSSSRTRLLLSRALAPFVTTHDIRISSDHGDDLTEHYKRYPWELFLGR